MAETVHRCPPDGQVLMPCCDRSPFEVLSDRMSIDPTLVTCEGRRSRPAPTAAEVTAMVDETAKAEMRRQGRDPEVWDRLPSEVQDQLRLAALDRLRSLA